MEYIWDFKDKKAYNNRTGHYKTNVQLDFILKNSNGKFDRILDIAGGAGRFSIPLLNYSKNITTLDINEKAIQLLNEREKAISTICGDFMEVEFKNTYTLILCIEATAYFPDWTTFFNKINLLLENNGRFIFTYTNPHSWRFLLRNIKHLGKPRHYTEMKFSDFKKLLHDCNFEIENTIGMNWTLLPVVSNSKLVSFFEFIEKKFRLNKWRGQSPWLIISAKKRS